MTSLPTKILLVQKLSPPVSLNNVYYSLLLNVSATGYGHLQGATNFIFLYGIHIASSHVYVNVKYVRIVSYLYKMLIL